MSECYSYVPKLEPRTWTLVQIVFPCQSKPAWCYWVEQPLLWSIHLNNNWHLFSDWSAVVHTFMSGTTTHQLVIVLIVACICSPQHCVLNFNPCHLVSDKPVNTSVGFMIYMNTLLTLSTSSQWHQSTALSLNLDWTGPWCSPVLNKLTYLGLHKLIQSDI